MMKGIILAGGSGTRLYPSTLVISKQLLPIYDKPMIYYPLSVLMLAGIRSILIISTPLDIPRFQKLFGNGSQLGLEISYAIQAKPEGIAQAFLIGKSFISNHSVALILGDNFFYGQHLRQLLTESIEKMQGGLIFGYHVKDPERYGVVAFDINGVVTSIEEKPQTPLSPYAIPGLYFYDANVVEIAASLVPSLRNELEITDIHRKYLEKGKLQVQILGKGFAWLDAGTHESLQMASLFIQTIQQRQAIKVACIEEIALHMGYIDMDQYLLLAQKHAGSDYGNYLLQCIEEDDQKFCSDFVFL